jgi:hypothetical protein
VTVTSVNEKRRADINAYAQRVVDAAPPLTAEQRDRLAILLHNPPPATERREAS